MVIRYSCHVGTLLYTLIKHGVFNSEGLLLITQEVLSDPSYTLRGIFLSPAFLAVTDSTCIFSCVDHKKQKKERCYHLMCSFSKPPLSFCKKSFYIPVVNWIGNRFGFNKVTFHLENLSWFSSWKHKWMCCFHSLVAVALAIKTKIIVNDEFGSILCSYPGCII